MKPSLRGIEVGPAGQHHAVQQVQHADHVGVVPQRRNDHRHRPGLDDGVVVAGADR